MEENVKAPNRRDQVKGFIATGNYTKQEIADELSVNVHTVSSQLTYLSWMGFFVLADEDKKLRFVSKEEKEAAQAAAMVNRKAKTSASKRTPQEQANALAKTIKAQEKAQAKWMAKSAQVAAELLESPDDEELQDIADEINANLTITIIKLKRNVKLAADLPAAEEVTETPDASGNDDDETDSEDELL